MHSNGNTLDMFNRARYLHGHIKSSVGRAKQEPSKSQALIGLRTLIGLLKTLTFSGQNLNV
jgi:hypothetical protein